MRIEGTITTWKDDQGYGFITPDIGGPQVFVHVKAFLDAKVRPILNDRVAFELTTDERGRLQAIYVRREGTMFRLRSVRRSDAALIGFAVLFLVALLMLALLGKLHGVFAGLYWLLSFFTFMTYRQDKSAARNGLWRIEEFTLHVKALTGGWPGALIAQRVLRHKSRKTSFLVVFWITVIVNIGALIGLAELEVAETLWHHITTFKIPS
jgi:uncharacterized membrane protein YsdA (DUF1294 family)/cold shock CspA family protein